LKITCLLVKDGEEYCFIHKSVQEYYAAAFITRKPDVVVQDIYRKLSEGRGYEMWAQELRFLSEIDPYRYNKYGLIPTLSKFVNITQKELPNLTLENVLSHVKEIVEKCSLGIKTSGGVDGMISIGRSMPWGMDDLFTHNLLQLNHKATNDKLLAADSELLKAAQSEPEPIESPNCNVVFLRIGVIVKRGFLKEETEKVIRTIADRIFKSLSKANEFVTHEEKQESILKLLG
jgi:hypothetical protein